MQLFAISELVRASLLYLPPCCTKEMLVSMQELTYSIQEIQLSLQKLSLVH